MSLGIRQFVRKGSADGVRDEQCRASRVLQADTVLARATHYTRAIDRYTDESSVLALADREIVLWLTTTNFRDAAQNPELNSDDRSVRRRDR